MVKDLRPISVIPEGVIIAAKNDLAFDELSSTSMPTDLMLLARLAMKTSCTSLKLES